MSEIAEKEDAKTEVKSPFLTKKQEDKEDKDIAEETYEKKQQDDLLSKTKENAVFSRQCKLYFMSTKTKKLETRGSGKLMILKSKSKLHKLIMIRDKLMLKGADHYISPSSDLVKAVQVENSFVWVALDDKSDAEENYKRTTYFASFYNQKEADEFKDAYVAAQENNKKVFVEIKKQMEADKKV